MGNTATSRYIRFAPDDHILIAHDLAAGPAQSTQCIVAAVKTVISIVDKYSRSYYSEILLGILNRLSTVDE